MWVCDVQLDLIQLLALFDNCMLNAHTVVQFDFRAHYFADSVRLTRFLILKI